MAMEKESWVSKLKKRVRRVLGGNDKPKSKKETARTKNVSDQLRKSGLSEEEIRRLKGK